MRLATIATLGLALFGMACGPRGIEPEHPSILPAELEGYRLRPEEPLADLAEAVSIELFTLHPNPYGEEGKPANATEDYHEYKILGRVELTLEEDPRHSTTIAQTLALLQKSMRENSTMAAACFNPRHGLRYTLPQGAVDLVICFECLQFRRYEPDGTRSGDLLSSNHEGSLDALFGVHGLTKHSE